MFHLEIVDSLQKKRRKDLFEAVFEVQSLYYFPIIATLSSKDLHKATSYSCHSFHSRLKLTWNFLVTCLLGWRQSW